jgi:hypothetical protein
LLFFAESGGMPGPRADAILAEKPMAGTAQAKPLLGEEKEHPRRVSLFIYRKKTKAGFDAGVA